MGGCLSTARNQQPLRSDSSVPHNVFDANNEFAGQGCADKDEEMVITSIRATDLALGLGRLPAGFYIRVHHSGFEWRTETKPVSVNNGIVEWSRLIPIPSDPSASISLMVQASFELDPMLGNGEQLRTLVITVEQLLDRSTKNLVFSFLPNTGDVVSPCSSLFVTVGRRNRGSDGPSVLGPHCSIIVSRSQLEETTDRGHVAFMRYRKQGERGDLEYAIQQFGEALSICPSDHPCYAAAQSNMAMGKLVRYRVGDTDASGDAPLALYRNSLAARPVGHLDRPSTLLQLAIVHLVRFHKLRNKAEAAQAMAFLREVIGTSSVESHENRAAKFMLHLSARRKTQSFMPNSTDVDPRQLTIQLLDRFQRGLRSLSELSGLNGPKHLMDLSRTYKTRFELFGEITVLGEAISMQQRAVNLTPDGHPDKPRYLDRLGDSFLTRFRHLGETSDLEEAILRQRAAVGLTVDDDPHKCRYRHNLGNSILTRFERHGVLGDLEDAISTLQGAVDLAPVDHVDKPIILDNLGAAYRIRFERLGELGNLEEAIRIQRVALDLTRNGHHFKHGCLTGLAVSLALRSDRLGDINDLEEGISMQRDAIGLVHDGYLHKPGMLNNLCKSLLVRFKRLGELRDLDEAILGFQGALDLTADGHPNKPMLLSNLGDSFRTRFEYLGELSYLQEAISKQQDSVNLTPNSHPYKPGRLSHLAVSFLTRFRHLGETSDLEQAISRQQDAVNLTSHGHFAEPGYLMRLGKSYLIRFECLGERHDLEQALLIYSHAACAPAGPIDVRLHASRQWIFCARRLCHNSLLSAYSIAIRLLPQRAWIGLSLAHRYRELAQDSDVVREAAAAALDSGCPETAVEWLEQGRSVVWGELFQLRSPYDELLSAHPSLARRLHELSVALEQVGAAHEKSLDSQMHPPTMSLQQEADRHRRLAIERDEVLRDIRALPGFERFFLHKEFSQLRASAHAGPVVILNAAETRCDALVVLADVDHVIHVPLPNFTIGRSKNFRTFLNGVIRLDRGVSNDDRYGHRVPQQDLGSWESMLSFLWKCVVKPVLDALAISAPGNLSRVFWCPTGPLTFLPIHAAGFYGTRFLEPGYKAFDFVVSSYVPTLSILAPSRKFDPTPRSDLRLLAVRQPLSDGQRKLPGVVTELEHLNTVVANSPFVGTTLTESSVGTVEEVVALMKDTEWVHFACHGVQDAATPTDSGLCLADHRRLKVSDIIALSRPQGGLAFLSACQTAMGDEDLSDEAVHIAAAMLFAGYGGVIGTMWSISDGLAPRVARDVYEELLLNSATPDYREAARALHVAVGRLRDSNVSFHEWLPFIHVGL